MGDRYVLEVICPECNHCDKDVYFAPTCGITVWKCPKCGYKVDLHKYAGIGHKAISNIDVTTNLCQDLNTKKKLNKEK